MSLPSPQKLRQGQVSLRKAEVEDTQCLGPWPPEGGQARKLWPEGVPGHKLVV